MLFSQNVQQYNGLRSDTFRNKQKNKEMKMIAKTRETRRYKWCLPFLTCLYSLIHLVIVYYTPSHSHQNRFEYNHWGEMKCKQDMHTNARFTKHPDAVATMIRQAITAILLSVYHWIVPQAVILAIGYCVDVPYCASWVREPHHQTHYFSSLHTTQYMGWMARIANGVCSTHCGSANSHLLPL